MMAAIVVPVGDCNIAMTRACFDRASILLVFGSPVVCWAGFAALTDNRDFAGFLADFDIEILHSAHDGVASHHRSPASAISPARQDLGAPMAPKSDGSTAQIAAECQSFLPAVIIPIQRRLVRICSTYELLRPVDCIAGLGLLLIRNLLTAPSTNFPADRRDIYAALSQ